MLHTIVIPGVTVFPRLSWRWESETDILSGSYRTAEQGQLAESVEVSSPNGAVAVLDVVDGELCGLDVVIWPDVETVSGLQAPAPEMAGRVTLPPVPPGTARQLEVELAIEVDSSEHTLHLCVGPARPVTVLQVADHLMIEVDQDQALAGFWLTSVPPFPSGA